MRWFRRLAVMLVIVAGIGYGLYHYGTAYASDKVLEAVTTKLEESGQLESVRETLRNDPSVQKYLANQAQVNPEQLPFTTKEQAVKKLVPKVGLSRLQEIQKQAQGGLSSSEQAVLLQELQQTLSEDEINALKYIAYQELMK